MVATTAIGSPRKVGTGHRALGFKRGCFISERYNGEYSQQRPDMKRDELNHGSATSLSVLPLLLPEGEVPDKARQALLENRLRDAGEVLMQEYGLDCFEASHLLDVCVCNQDT